MPLTQHTGSKAVQHQRDSAGQSHAGRRGLGRESSGGVWEGCCGIVIPCKILHIVQVLTDVVPSA